MKRTIRLLSLLLALVLLLPGLPARAAAYSGSCGDDLTWSFDEGSGVLTISGSGAMNDYQYQNPNLFQVPWLDFGHQIKSVILPEGLTRIGSGAFWVCDSLPEAAIPESVTEIGAGAFLNTALESVTIPENVRRIEADAFCFCSRLQTVSILNRDCDIFDSSGTFSGPAYVTICGYPGSTAERYAQKYGYPFRSVDAVSFTDVDDSAYYAAPVAWAVAEGITKGTTRTTFSPDSTCTRAQVVTFLWRAKGSPEPVSDRNPFSDVAADQYYTKAVLWAVENGVTTGTSAARFSPDAGCTRGQVVTFLWRVMGEPAPKLPRAPFSDVPLSEYYNVSVAWAVENGVTSGTSLTRFSPGSVCTRAQIVTFLHRAYVEPLPPAPGGLIGVSMPTRNLERWWLDGLEINRVLKSAGYEVDLQYAANDPALQISQIENMIFNGAKLLIVAAVDGDSLRGVLRQAREAGCAVIAYDRPIASADVNYYVTFDNFSVGAVQGRFLADRLDLKNAGGRVYNIELVGGSPDDGNAYVFYDGAMSVLRPYIEAGTLRVVSGQVEFEDVATYGWSTEYAQARFENLLTRYYADKPLHAVLASNDSTAQGVAMALADGYRNSVYPLITGQDCDIFSVRLMLQGKQAMSVFKKTGILTERICEMADAIMREKDPGANAVFTTYDGLYTYPAFFCEPVICTVQTVRSLLIDSGYYTAEEVGL